jgi:hypothetical protein
MRRKTKEFLRPNENESTLTRNFGTQQREKFIARSVFFKKLEQISKEM